ncbi:MAG: SUMF1/EgtB/PvdO family nonheme iron enzyme [Planctomycetes bacterium]|nr:SUMF1/EgtB/PvdO family nonheme iron enzyme [Planctomycetota bacterium]
MADPFPKDTAKDRANDTVAAESRRQFEQFVSRHGIGAEDAFLQLCAAFPAIAEDLKKMRAAAIDAMAARPATVVETLRKRFGNDIDPNVTLDPREAAPSDSAPSPVSKPSSTLNEELIQKISSHSSPSPRYTFKGEVARGGMGAILKVWDGDLRRNLAMKVILGEGLEQEQKEPTDPARIARFLEEAQVTGQLDHPGIVPVHELGVGADGRVFFTMRLIHGRDFQTILDLVKLGKEGWTQTRALGTIQRVCEAMAYAHAKGVIHRDLKPANIMVGHFGETYVMDWGLAKVLGKKEPEIKRKITDSYDESGVKSLRRDAALTESGSGMLTMDGEVLGTPCYMSPEQALGRVNEMGPASDVYSAGAILYHLLAGSMPYVEPGTAATPMMVLDRVRKGAPRPLRDFNSKLSNEIVAICEKSMSRDPAKRYPDMRAMADDLRNYLEGRVVRAYATGAFVEFKKWVLRNKGTAAAILLAILVAMGGLALVAWKEKQKQVELAGKNTEIQKEKDKVDLANTKLQDANAQILAEKKRAEQSEKDAIDKKKLAEESLAEYQRMADVKRLVDIQEQADVLFLSYPPPRAAMEKWLVDAKELAKKEGDHRKTHESLTRAFEDTKTTLAPDAKNEIRWKLQVLSELVKGLDDINKERGQAGRVRGYLNVWDATTSADSGWPEAIASISSVKECPLYLNLKIQPQYGLKPLGRDAKSGLWEFVHIETGKTPERGPDGKWKITDETGLVFVLVPGGKFDMGAVAPSRTSPANTPNVDPFADSGIGPVHSVTLKPFFISKYEMTQPQWKRLTGDDPSAQNGTFPLDAAPRPVNSVNWDMCQEALPKVGLILPTEAQWEFAARGLTSSVWWSGNDTKSTDGAANVRGKDDGFESVAPVGSTRPNAFGLFDTMGNVWEWCRDTKQSYSIPGEGDDGARPNQKIKIHVIRGGSFNDDIYASRSANRNSGNNTFRTLDLGVRPVRAMMD